MFFDMDGVPHIEEQAAHAEEVSAPIEEPLNFETTEEPISFEMNPEPIAQEQEFVHEDVINEELLIEDIPVEEVLQDEESSGSFADIEKFANSDQSAINSTYSIRIVGIDTEKIRRDLEEALNDARLFRDFSEVWKTLRRGELSLTQLSALKAAIIIQRIKSLPVDISWSQHAQTSDDISA